MKMPLVTIAIPAYNAEKHIAEAILSVLNQSFKDFELIIINDGSTDNTISIISSFHDERIIVIDDGENKGLIERLNQSISLAKGEYYARMDADDIMYITRIETQVKFLETHPDIDVVGSSIMTIDDNNKIVGSGYYYGKVELFVHPTVIAKTSWFKSNPYSDWAHRAEDAELWLRTSSRSRFWSLEEPLLFYREFGVPTRKKYIESMNTLLKLYSRYRLYEKSFWWFSKNTLWTYIKMVLCIFFDSIGYTDFLVKKRRRRPVPVDLILNEENLQISINHYSK